MIILTSILMISKVPTYSLKRITIKRSITIFLLFSICLYFGLLIIYTFKVLFLTGIVYILFIPVSYFHYRKLNSKEKILEHSSDAEEVEDVL